MIKTTFKCYILNNTLLVTILVHTLHRFTSMCQDINLLNDDPERKHRLSCVSENGWTHVLAIVLVSDTLKHY